MTVQQAPVPSTSVPERRERRRGPIGWFDPRGRRLGGWAFALNRITGLGLVLYLYLHLGILSLLAQGPSAWGSFVSVATSPPVLALDVLLLAGLLIHGLNGIRLTLVGFGIVADRQKAMLVALGIFGAILLVIGALRIFR
jgi:succinate dehydrogenase / fumarate reductase cytochrome b subunit